MGRAFSLVMTRTQTLTHAALFMIGLGLAASPGRVRAQSSEFGSEQLTPPTNPDDEWSDEWDDDTELPRLTLAPTRTAVAPPSLDLYATDHVMRRGRRFRRAGAVVGGLAALFVVGGAVGVASYTETSCSSSRDLCIDLGPIGGYLTMAVGGVMLVNALALWIVGVVVERHHLRALRASVDRHGANVGLDLRF